MERTGQMETWKQKVHFVYLHNVLEHLVAKITCGNMQAMLC